MHPSPPFEAVARCGVSRYTTGTEVGSWAWMIVLVTKCCCGCNLFLPLSEYYERGTSQAGLQSRCKACSKKAVRQWESDNPARRRDGKRACTYGISADEVDAFLAIPTCQACGSTFDSDRAIKLDHCHKNGHVRGAICHACNLAMSGSAEVALLRLGACREYLLRDLERQCEQV
jgi:hypothetical protein